MLKHKKTIPALSSTPVQDEMKDEEKQETANTIINSLPKEDQTLAQSVEEETSDWTLKVIDYFTNQDPQTLTLLNRGKIKKTDFINKAKGFLHRQGVREKIIPIIIEKLSKYMWGYYILEDLINDKTISDIKVLSYDNIRIKRLGERLDSGVAFKDQKDYERFVNLVATKNQINISNINAIQTFTDKINNEDNILRFNIATAFITSTGSPYLHIRKVPKSKNGITELINEKMMDENTANYLIDKAKHASGIIFCGKGASGKTTLMNALLEHIPHNRSGLVIQENEELFAKKHPDLMFEHVVTNSGESKIQYTLKDLARNGLLTDLDYFVIGEIKGDEALYFLNACTTGHQAWCSVHGNSSTEAMFKLADYIKYASDYSQQDIMKMLTALEVVVFMKNYKVQEISEVAGFDDNTGNLIYRRIFNRDSSVQEV